MSEGQQYLPKMAEFQLNRCYACKKLFCCPDCCSTHIKTHHPGRESDCPLCRSEFPLISNFSNPEFLCHVVIHHLPLQCTSCGDCFTSTEDLKSLVACTRRLLRKPTTALKNLEKPTSATPPSAQASLNSVTPKERYSIEGNFNHNFETLTSPPEFTRHTSTPMHIGLSRQNSHFAFKTPKSPSFSLKTPNSSQGRKPDEDSKSLSKAETPHIQKKKSGLSGRDSKLQELLELSESVYLSFSPSTRGNSSEKVLLKSILSSKSAMAAQSPPEHCPELSGTQVDMDLTEALGSIAEANELKSPPERVLLKPEVRDSGKRVRFSDQFHGKKESEVRRNLGIEGTPNSDHVKAGSESGPIGDPEVEVNPDRSDVTENEEFFEARQSLSEFSNIQTENLSPGIPAGEEVVSSTSSLGPGSHNLEFGGIGEGEEGKENVDNENVERGNPRISEDGVSRVTQVSERSRVVMMVLVEKTGGASLDLKPIIDSGLRTLESVASMRSEEDLGKFGGKEDLILAVESYKRVSSVECFRKPGDELGRVVSEAKHRGGAKNEGEVGGSQGILSVVANAVKTAFKNISDAVSTRHAEETIAEKKEQQVPEIMVEPPSFVQLQESLSSLTPARPQKRSRDDLMSVDTTELDEVDPNDIRSPEHKRQRGWYRIRAREPIARMRSEPLMSSTELSSDNQKFQLESLPSADSFFFPSRVQKATQTDR